MLLRRITDRCQASVESNLNYAHILDVIYNVRWDLKRAHFCVPTSAGIDPRPLLPLRNYSQ